MKIILADPHPEVRSALHLLLNHIPQVSEIIQVSSLMQLLAQCAQLCPALILFDLELLVPARAGSLLLVDVIRILHRLCPGCLVVVMSSQLEGAQDAQNSGANGFISKLDAPDEIAAHIVRLLFTHSSL